MPPSRLALATLALVLAAAAAAAHASTAAASVNPAWAAIWGLPLDFASAIPALHVTGSIPDWLTGSVFRN